MIAADVSEPFRVSTALGLSAGLGEEPGPLVEALDLLPAELVHQGLKDRVGRQDRERGEPSSSAARPAMSSASRRSRPGSAIGNRSAVIR